MTAGHPPTDMELGRQLDRPKYNKKAIEPMIFSRMRNTIKKKRRQAAGRKLGIDTENDFCYDSIIPENDF